MKSEVLCLNCGWNGKLEDNIFVCPDCKSEGNLIAAGDAKE